MDTVLQQLIELVKSAAPALWEIARRQVGAQNIVDIVWSVILVLLLVAIYRLAKWMITSKIASINDDWQYRNDDDKLHTIGDWWEWLESTDKFGLGAIAFILITPIVFGILINITTVIMRVYNPDYYAIQMLLGMTK